MQQGIAVGQLAGRCQGATEISSSIAEILESPFDGTLGCKQARGAVDQALYAMASQIGPAAGRHFSAANHVAEHWTGHGRADLGDELEILEAIRQHCIAAGLLEGLHAAENFL